MKKGIIVLLATLALAAPVYAQAASSAHYKGDNLAPQAKLSLDEARAIAQKTSPGKVVEEELEKEEGGSGLRYSFDIQQDKATHEVGVDAVTGKVLENSEEGKEGEEDKDDKESKEAD